VLLRCLHPVYRFPLETLPERFRLLGDLMRLDLLAWTVLAFGFFDECLQIESVAPNGLPRLKLIATRSNFP